MAALSLDVIIPTYNRARFLRALLRSIAAAPVPPDLSPSVIVVDNGSTDNTRAVAERMSRRFKGRFRYVLETRPGKSAALNAGIRATTGDIVAFLDDDETISAGWFHTVARAFRHDAIDFISGRCLPRWKSTARPRWLPPRYPAVIGAVDAGTRTLEFRRDYDGTLSGGNSAVRRTILDRVGLFSTRLGPRADSRLLCCEDEDIYLRLLDAGARGVYSPDLLVYHHVHTERLTRGYHRRWCFWRGVSKAFLHDGRKPDLPHVGSVPRFLYGAAARGLVRLLRPSLAAHGAAQRFSAELAIWDLAGFMYGRYLYRPAEAPFVEVTGDAAAAGAAGVRDAPAVRVAAIG